jgi:hypothetical protein
LNIENLIDTGDLNALGTAISNLQPVTGIESRIAYVFDQWYKYVSQYDTVFYGSDSFQHIQIWVNDSTYFYNSIIIDTADFRVHYRPLADTVFLKIYSLALSSPFKYDPAAKFGRNFLMFAGYLMTYYDTAEFELPPLSGRVTPACSGGGVDGIPVKLFFGNGAPTGLETVTIEDGYFRFSPLDLVKLDTSSDYYIRVYFPLDSNHISVTASLNHLIFDSLVNIDCTFPGPIPLSNGTIYDTAFKLFPNPTDGNIRLEYLGGAWVTDYVCYNIFGQAVLSGLISAENNEIDFNDYSIPDGYYIMKIIGNQTIKPVSIPLVIYRK